MRAGLSAYLASRLSAGRESGRRRKSLEVSRAPSGAFSRCPTPKRLQRTWQHAASLRKDSPVFRITCNLSLSDRDESMQPERFKNASPIALILILVVVLGTSRSVWAQSAEPILRVEVGTHNAGIWDMAIDPSNRLLVTGSEDKTVRVWDISGRGELLRTLRPPVGEGEEGHIFAVALSPDARVLACGGRTGSLKQADACIYLFDRATGAITGRLG